MLYLIKSGNYLKIGYSSNVDKRLESYRTCNPDFTVLDTIEGDEKLEKTLHKICKEFKMANRQEWFYLDPFIINTWNKLKESNFITIPESINNIQEINVDYKDKYDKLTKDHCDLISSHKILKARYSELTEHVFNFNKELKEIVDYKQISEELQKENAILKESLLEIQTKYILLLESLQKS